jgi:hypothetical protein
MSGKDVIIRSMAGVIIMLIAAACAGNQPPIAPTRVPIVEAQPTATTAPTQVPTAVPTRVPTATPTAAPLPTATVAGASTPQALSANGPWLVYRTDHGVIAVNADGTGRTMLANEPILLSDLPDGASLSGGWLALRDGTPSLGEFSTTDQTVTLGLLELPDGQLQPITPLFSPEMQQAIKASAGDRTSAIEAAIAVMENRDTLKWSPDGRYLAFIAALDGPSSDLYSYDVTTKKIARLTDGANQAASLSWSPDSQWIVHEEVESFGTGAGWNVKAVWAARPDGNEVKKVYATAADSGGEIFVGWTTPDTFIVYTWNAGGPREVRAVNVNTGDIQPLRSVDMFQSFAFDVHTGTYVYTVDNPDASHKTPGLYLDSNLFDKPQVIDRMKWYNVVWSPNDDRFYAQGEMGTLSVALSGQSASFEQETTLPAVSPAGNWRAFWGDGNFTQPAGLRLYSRDGQLQHEISDQPIAFAMWRPDAEDIFFVSDGALYYAALPDGEPVPIDDGVQISIEGGAGWVQR